MLGGCTSPLELVLNSGILAEKVAVANTEDLGASGALFSWKNIATLP